MQIEQIHQKIESKASIIAKELLALLHSLFSAYNFQQSTDMDTETIHDNDPLTPIII